ncbi:SH3 domain-binding protein 5, partial [Nibea albiflora]
QDARQKFRSVLVEATVKLDELVKKIGKAVEESKPYWEARRLARQRTEQDFSEQMDCGLSVSLGMNKSPSDSSQGFSVCPSRLICL